MSTEPSAFFRNPLSSEPSRRPEQTPDPHHEVRYRSRKRSLPSRVDDVRLALSAYALGNDSLVDGRFGVPYAGGDTFADLVDEPRGVGQSALFPTVALAGCEYWMMRAQTPAEYATALRWLHVPIFVTTVGFVLVQLRAGRPWFAFT